MVSRMWEDWRMVREWRLHWIATCVKIRRIVSCLGRLEDRGGRDEGSVGKKISSGSLESAVFLMKRTKQVFLEAIVKTHTFWSDL